MAIEKKKKKKKAATKTSAAKKKTHTKTKKAKKRKPTTKKDHSIEIYLDANGEWAIEKHEERDVKAREKVNWRTPEIGFVIQVQFPDTVVSPSTILVPGGAQVSTTPSGGKHPYQLVVDGVPQPVGTSAPGIIIE